MNIMQFQEMFKAWDAFDLARLGTFWHDDIAINIVGLPGREGMLRIRGKEAALEFAGGVKEQQQESGGAVQHIPDWIIIEEDLAAVRGTLRLTLPNSADSYGSYLDFFKLKDGTIIEYNLFYYNPH